MMPNQGGAFLLHGKGLIMKFRPQTKQGQYRYVDFIFTFKIDIRAETFANYTPKIFDSNQRSNI